MKTTTQKELEQHLTHKRPSLISRTKGYPALIMGLSISALLGGIILTSLSILGLIKPLLLSGFSSMLGSVLIMLGGFVLFEELRSHKDHGKVLHEALNRILKDRN
jgi:high-affinity Fe2+/Pb2+ permease